MTPFKSAIAAFFVTLVRILRGPARYD